MRSIKRIIELEQDWTIGLLIAILLVISLMIVIYSVRSKAKYTLLSYAIGIVLVIVLSFQMSYLVGAVKLLNNSYDISNFVSFFSSRLADSIDTITEKELGWYITRRVLWSLLFMALGGFFINFTMRVKRRGSASYIDYDSNVSGGTNDWGF